MTSIMNEISSFLIRMPGLLIAIVFHELAHGWVAYKLGDNTAKDAGRLTLNPIKHLDPVGFLCLLVFRFGWAKPVPINTANFKNRKIGTILVSLAGPLVNFAIAFLVAVGFRIVFKFNINMSPLMFDIIKTILWYNIMLGIFNLIPLPPLDGSKILASLLPLKQEYYFYKYERYFNFVLIMLIITRMTGRIMSPMINMALITVFKIIGV